MICVGFCETKSCQKINAPQSVNGQPINHDSPASHFVSAISGRDSLKVNLVWHRKDIDWPLISRGERVWHDTDSRKISWATRDVSFLAKAKEASWAFGSLAICAAEKATKMSIKTMRVAEDLSILLLFAFEASTRDFLIVSSTCFACCARLIVHYSNYSLSRQSTPSVSHRIDFYPPGSVAFLLSTCPRIWAREVVIHTRVTLSDALLELWFAFRLFFPSLPLRSLLFHKLSLRIPTLFFSLFWHSSNCNCVIGIPALSLRSLKLCCAGFCAESLSRFCFSFFFSSSSAPKKHYKSISMLLSRAGEWWNICVVYVWIELFMLRSERNSIFPLLVPKRAKKKSSKGELWSIDADCLNWFAFQSLCWSNSKRLINLRDSCRSTTFSLALEAQNERSWSNRLYGEVMKRRQFRINGIVIYGEKRFQMDARRLKWIQTRACVHVGKWEKIPFISSLCYLNFMFNSCWARVLSSPLIGEFLLELLIKRLRLARWILERWLSLFAVAMRVKWSIEYLNNWIWKGSKLFKAQKVWQNPLQVVA